MIPFQGAPIVSTITFTISGVSNFEPLMKPIDLRWFFSSGFLSIHALNRIDALLG